MIERGVCACRLSPRPQLLFWDQRIRVMVFIDEERCVHDRGEERYVHDRREVCARRLEQHSLHELVMSLAVALFSACA